MINAALCLSQRHRKEAADSDARLLKHTRAAHWKDRGFTVPEKSCPGMRIS